MATTKATTLAHTLGGISSDISTAEINRLDGLTGDIQTLLNLKAPIASPTFTGTANISSGATFPANPTITLGSNATFPAGHILQVESSGGTSVTSTTDAGNVVNSGVELTIGTSNKAFILVTGWAYTAFGGSTSDRVISIYKEVSGSDTLIQTNQPGSWGETETQFARSAISGSYLDNTTGTVRYKVKVSSRGSAGTIHYRTIVTVFEVKG